MNITYSKCTKNNLIICSWCNQPSIIVWLHVHGQCSNYGLNIDECCRGESMGVQNKPDKSSKDEKE